MSPRHTDRSYEEELQDLRDRVLRMAGRVEAMLQGALRALVTRDAELARRTIEDDHEVNQAEIDADELCLQILARRQPMASDLRFITIALKMVTDLERIADLSVNICERAIDLCAGERILPYDGIERMGTIVHSMIHDAIDAFVSADPEEARAVIARDDEVDALYVQVFRDLLERMRSDAGAIERAIHVQSVAKFLERMADHGTNLAEQVIFMVGGEDVRHEGKLD